MSGSPVLNFRPITAPPKRSKPRGRGFVYFFQVDGGGPIKIGWAYDVYDRLTACQLYCPYRLIALAATPGTHRDEWRHFQRFSLDRLRGEWFAPSAELLAYIRTLPPATISLSRTERTKKIAEDPSTRIKWFSPEYASCSEAAEAIGLPVQLLRALFGPSGRKTGTSGEIARRIGARGGLKKGVTAQQARDAAASPEEVLALLSQPDMTYNRAAEILGPLFPATTLRRRYGKPRQ